MRVLFYLDSDGMVNVNPRIRNQQHDGVWYFSMVPSQFDLYLHVNNLKVYNNQIVNATDGFIFGALVQQ